MRKDGLDMQRGYDQLEATELFCPHCKKATVVRKRMLLALPNGDKYDYVCTVCGNPIGAKMDKKPGNFGGLIK